ncbi:MAG: hypothetical protein HY302_15380 [Opitutae bacterium]|nr:hypothetical protein [Opitutae bacterium]
MPHESSSRASSELRPESPGARRRLALGFLCLALSVVALLPWWRNHAYLRDFYDYGLFINVNARIAEGQRPFVDFVTPGQSATFLLDSAAERIGGGTYEGMTWGAAGLIVIGVVGLTLLLARRFDGWVAGSVAGAVVIGSAAQHTIIFYNSLGVLSLALVGWSFAIAPTLRRADFGWHSLAALGLFVGGLNKINFHLVACAVAAGWALWSGVSGRTPWRQVAATLLFVLVFGGVLPVAVEMAWTGADWRTWYYNVVQLPLSARGGRISLLFSSRLYLETLHDYYGKIRLPQVGLLGVLMPLLAVVAVWRAGGGDGRRERVIAAVLAGACSALAGLALLLTNNEIAYMTLSAVVVLTVSLWLGFRLEAKGVWFALGVLVPVFLLGVFGWESAWQGQRSQFGHSVEPRAGYVAGEQIGPDFAYLKGTFVPPSLASSLVELAEWRRSLAVGDRERIFYGPGVEWLERIWPARKVRGLPLVAAGFEGERETVRLDHAVLQGDAYRYLLVAVAWDHWSAETERVFPRRFTKESIGPFFYAYGKLPPTTVWARPLEFNVGFGGNADASRLRSTAQLLRLDDGRGFLGTTGRTCEVELSAPSRRASGEAVLRRLAPPNGHSAAAVRFRVYAVDQGGRYLRWSEDLVLPPGGAELVVPTGRLDASGLPLLFTAEVPESMAGRVAAGWRALALWDSIDTAERPPLLQEGAALVRSAVGDFRAAVLKDALAGSPVFVRNSWLENGACRLSAGGEVWIRLSGIFSNIELTATSRAGSRENPKLRVVFYKGGRIETFHPADTDVPGTVRFTAWSPENDGWLGVLANPDHAGPGCIIRIESAQRP